MYLLYVDGSGSPDLGCNGDVYVLAGICVHEGTWYALQKRVAGLKKKYEFPGVPMELHAKDFCCGYPEQEKIPEFDSLDRNARRQAVRAIRAAKLMEPTSADERRAIRKRHAATDAFVHLARRERSQLFEDALDLVGSHDGIRLFAEIVDKKHLFRTTGERSALRSAFAQIVSRFEGFIARDNGPGFSNHDKGMLLMDREPTNETNIIEMFDGYREKGHPWGPLQHVIEAPFFVDSSTTYGVQAIDLCAYAVRRYVERAAKIPSFERENFLRIFHKFDRAGPKLHGVRHHCARGSCPCLICMARGHDEPPAPIPEAAA